MTCICGHHEKAHLSDIGLCAAPEGCNCNHFRKPAPNEEPYLIDHAKATQDAEWLAGSQADTGERNLARAYLAMRDEVAGFTAMWEEREKAHDAEIAEAKRDVEALEAELAALRAPVPSGVTEAMVERFIAAMDVASDADVGREEGIRYALSAALAEARKDSERLDWLERHQGRVSGPALDNPRWVVWADDAANDVEADNFRDAIDRARRTPQPETPE